MHRNIVALAVTLLFAIAGTSANPATALHAQDLQPAHVVPIQINGDPATHFSLVILGDGYTASQMKTFRDNVDKHLNILWSFEPFRSYRNYFNVYAIEIASPESGITCDPAHRQQRHTALGLYFDGGCTNPNARGILYNAEEAKRYARLATPDFDQILVIANTDTYGGIGGTIATTSGGNALGPYITPHEIGHSLGGLQDEYTYYQRGVKGAPYRNGEPASVHHTLMTEDEMRANHAKWWRWLGDGSDAGGIIGRYEGGQYADSGIWRPSKHSMMISLGYYYDQVSRERLTQRISAQVDLISGSTANKTPVAPDAVLWIETAHPVYDALHTTWTVDGKTIDSADDARTLDLATLHLANGSHTVAVRAVDSTAFVRDPGIRDTSFTATRTWSIAASGATPKDTKLKLAFTSTTQTTHPIGGTDVVYVETTHVDDHAFDVAWKIDGRAITSSRNTPNLNLAKLHLTAGTHKLTATLTDSQHAGIADSRTWTIDNTLPTATYLLDGDTTSVRSVDGSRHYFARDSFTMKLVPADDSPGYVVTEFRLDGDGWHHYYGWPDAPPGAAFRFTPRGTMIKELVYGSLSSEGLSPQPWETRAPGWGNHTIEYRARDAAGNIGDTQQFGVTVLPSPACTESITGQRASGIEITSGVTCLHNAVINGDVNVHAGATLVADHTRIVGALTSSGADAIEIGTTTVTGTSRVQNTGTTLNLFASTFGGITLQGNSTRSAPIISGNRVNGNLACDGMLLPPQTFGAQQIVSGTKSGTCL